MSSPSICLSSTKLSRSSDGDSAFGDQLHEVADDRHHRLHPPIAAARPTSDPVQDVHLPLLELCGVGPRQAHQVHEDHVRKQQRDVGDDVALTSLSDVVEDLAEALSQLGFILSMEPGDHSGVSICRHAVEMPSSISGIQRYTGLGSATVTEEFENTSVLWYALRMSSMRVNRKYC